MVQLPANFAFVYHVWLMQPSVVIFASSHSLLAVPISRNLWYNQHPFSPSLPYSAPYSSFQDMSFNLNGWPDKEGRTFNYNPTSMQMCGPNANDKLPTDYNSVGLCGDPRQNSKQCGADGMKVNSKDPSQKWDPDDFEQQPMRYALTDVDFALVALSSPHANQFRAGLAYHIVIGIGTHHNGFYEFYLSDKLIDHELPNAEAQKALDENPLWRSDPSLRNCGAKKSDADCQPRLAGQEGRWYTPPLEKGEHTFSSDEQAETDLQYDQQVQSFHFMYYDIPRNFECQHCTLQWV
ncbi:unnamed protein product [Amoebophrya sp. A120]|nr:unnamed protein product [Amoebophrya sp. A120]|eukprot:GSA120T00006706001.1